VIYHKRWGVETLYDVLKVRLTLENFSGKTAEAVRQDFYASIFLTGLESLLTRETDQELAKRSKFDKHKQTVNNMVSFNTIKSSLMDLFYNKMNPKSVLKKMFQLFTTNPTYTGRKRHVPRKQTNPREAVNYYRRRVKFCF
jgi:hypothetical protein